MNIRNKYEKEIEELKRLMDEVRTLAQSDENKKRKAYWDFEGVGNDSLAKIRPAVTDVLPFTIEFDRPGCAKLLGTSLVRALSDPAQYLIFTLKSNIFQFKEFPDCRPIGFNIGYFTGSGFEKSLFGGEQILTEDDAWVSRDPLIEDMPPVESMPDIDFYENRTMKQIHAFWETMCELVDPDFHVIFPQWNRSAWGMAWQMVGIEDLVIDYMEDPDWVRDLLHYLNVQRAKWTKERAKYLHEKVMPISLYNDEVTVPIVSPSMYTDTILPSEQEIAQMCGALNYWHSCGNTDILMPEINKLPMKMVHCSPWSDLRCAARTYSPDKAIQYCMQPSNDVMLNRDPQAVRSRLTDIREALRGRKAMVCADALDIISDRDAEIQRVKEWSRIAQEICLN